jgi:predicted Zn-dependent protease with MMP-like domain
MRVRKMIDWNKATSEEMDLFAQIANRAFDKLNADKMSTMMDIQASHALNPLRLDDLLAADDFNFAHDIYGIANHIDRDTGELTDCFLPRFTA